MNEAGSSAIAGDGAARDQSDDGECFSDEADSSFDSVLRQLARLPEASPAAWIPEHSAGARIGRFRIVSRLGRGGMGVVYLAVDETLGRNVALKTLPTELVGDGDRRRQFLREARSASAVVHPNVATIFEAGEADGHPYIAMEPIAGRTLRAILQGAGAPGELPGAAKPPEAGRGAGLPIERAVDVAVQIARGLAEAHKKGVIHRDLKPENVIVGDDGLVKILDFGLAKLRSGATGTADTESLASEVGRILGTPGYMSREQAEGTAVDERTDIFSLGVILFEMLAGRRPFVGQTAMQIAIAISRDAPLTLTALRSGVPAGLTAIVARCLEKDRDHRYPSCEALLADLGRVGATRAPSRGRRVVLVALAVAGALTIGWLALRTPANPAPALQEQIATHEARAPEEASRASAPPIAPPAVARAPDEAPAPRAAQTTVAQPPGSSRAVKPTARPPAADPLSDQF